MRAGGVRNNPYDGIIQTIDKGTQRRSRSSAHRFAKAKDGKKLDERIPNQVIDGGPKTRWNHEKPSSPQRKRSNYPSNTNVVEADAVRIEINSDKAALEISGNGTRDANQFVVSSKMKIPTADGEGCTAYKSVTCRPTGYGSDCGGEGEQKRPAGWAVINTKGEREEVSQSDEEQMLQLSQECIAEGAQTERPFSPARSEMNGNPPKRRKQQTSESRKRPRSSPRPNVAREIFEILRPETEPLEEKYFAEPQTEKMKEIHHEHEQTRACLVPERQEDRCCPELSEDGNMNQDSDTSLEEGDLTEQHEPLAHRGANEDISSSKLLKNIVITVQCKCPSECKHITSQPKRERRGGLPGCGSDPQASLSEDLRQGDRRNGELEKDEKRAGKDTLQRSTLQEGGGMKSLKKVYCDETNKEGERTNAISSMANVSFLKESEGTTGHRVHTNESRPGGAGSHNCQAHNSNSDESWIWEPLWPSGEDGYSLSREGVHIGLQVRERLLGHSESTQENLPTHTAGHQALICEDLAGPATAREEREFQPSHEDSSGDKRRSLQTAIGVVQPTERDADIKSVLKSAPKIQRSLTSPLVTTRESPRGKKRTGSPGRKEQLPQEQAVITLEGSPQKAKSDGGESLTQTPFTQTPAHLESPCDQAKNSGKRHRKRRSSRKRRLQNKEGTTVDNESEHSHGLSSGEQGVEQEQSMGGTEAESSKLSSPKRSNSENQRTASSYSQTPKTIIVNEGEIADRAESPLPEPVIRRAEHPPLTGEGNRTDAVHRTTKNKSMSSLRDDHVPQMKVPIKSDLEESIVDVGSYAARRERNSKGENLDALVDLKKLSKQSELCGRSSRRLRSSRTDGPRHETSTKALDEMSDNEDVKDNAWRPTASCSRSRGRSGTTQVAKVERENIHSMTTRGRPSRHSDTIHRGANVIDLTDAEADEEAATTFRAAGDDNDIAESLRELQKLSLQDREKAFFERPRCKYLTPLSRDENKLATQLFTRTKLDTRIVAIAEAGITLRGESFKRLRGTRWLDDEVLNAYVSLINSRNDAVFHELSEEHRSGIPRAYVFNTYFFTRLCSGSSGFDYPGVQGWTKRAKVDILQKDIILVPINLGNHHWVLSGIDMEHREILYLDSMHGPDAAKAVSKLKRWVFEELRSKHGEAVAQQQDPNSWKEVKHYYRVRRIGVLPETLEHREAKAGRVARIPRQGDGGSCGVFTAKIADCLSLGIKVYFKKEDIPLIRRRMALDLFRGYVPL